MAALTRAVSDDNAARKFRGAAAVTNFPAGASFAPAPVAAPQTTTQRVRAAAAAAATAAAAAEQPAVPVPMDAEANEGLTVRCTDTEASDAVAWLLSP